MHYIKCYGSETLIGSIGFTATAPPRPKEMPQRLSAGFWFSSGFPLVGLRPAFSETAFRGHGMRFPAILSTVGETPLPPWEMGAVIKVLWESIPP